MYLSINQYNGIILLKKVFKNEHLLFGNGHFSGFLLVHFSTKWYNTIWLKKLSTEWYNTIWLKKISTEWLKIKIFMYICSK